MKSQNSTSLCNEVFVETIEKRDEALLFESAMVVVDGTAQDAV